MANGESSYRQTNPARTLTVRTLLLMCTELGLTLAMPEMMMVLFFTGDLSFCLADWWSCLMAASATGSVPFSIRSSVSEEDKALLTVPPSIDDCSETRRSASLGLAATAFWVESEEHKLFPLNCSSNDYAHVIHNKHTQNILLSFDQTHRIGPKWIICMIWVIYRVYFVFCGWN